MGATAFMQSSIWLEEPEPNNPFACRAAYCHGYDVYGEMLGNAGWVLASIALPVADLVHPNALGWAFVIGQAAVVALLAKLERDAADESAVLRHHAMT